VLCSIAFAPGGVVMRSWSVPICSAIAVLALGVWPGSSGAIPCPEGSFVGTPPCCGLPINPADATPCCPATCCATTCCPASGAQPACPAERLTISSSPNPSSEGQKVTISWLQRPHHGLPLATVGRAGEFHAHRPDHVQRHRGLHLRSWCWGGSDERLVVHVNGKRFQPVAGPAGRCQGAALELGRGRHPGEAERTRLARAPGRTRHASAARRRQAVGHRRHRRDRRRLEIHRAPSVPPSRLHAAPRRVRGRRP
jgi:hypothetical protein